MNLDRRDGRRIRNSDSESTKFAAAKIQLELIQLIAVVVL